MFSSRYKELKARIKYLDARNEELERKMQVALDEIMLLRYQTTDLGAPLYDWRAWHERKELIKLIKEDK